MKPDAKRRDAEGRRKATLLEIADQLDREIAFAQGLAVAIHGLECEIEDQHTGAEALAEAHIERLQQISAELAQLRLKRR